MPKSGKKTRSEQKRCCINSSGSQRKHDFHHPITVMELCVWCWPFLVRSTHHVKCKRAVNRFERTEWKYKDDEKSKIKFKCGAEGTNWKSHRLWPARECSVIVAVVVWVRHGGRTSGRLATWHWKRGQRRMKAAVKGESERIMKMDSGTTSDSWWTEGRGLWSVDGSTTQEATMCKAPVCSVQSIDNRQT